MASKEQKATPKRWKPGELEWLEKKRRKIEKVRDNAKEK